MEIKHTVLIVDDDEALLELFVPLFEAQNLRLVTASSPADAFKVMKGEQVDLVITDVQMPQMSGISLFSKLQDAYPDIPVILITGFGSTEEAIKVVKQGAFHYFEKPIFDKLDLFWTTIREALAKRDMFSELAALQKEKSLRMNAPVAIVGQSSTIKKIMKSVQEVAYLPVTVVISGETGTGKELVARAIHELSERRDKPLFAINCTELATGLLESELFGHEKGAFTGAISCKKGLFEVANKGTLFLDEISEASLLFQSKLLRVLETKTFMRVGGTTPIYSDFRLLAATNKNLEEEVAAGRFRQDLFYRFNVYSIHIPPLRNRKQDIALIAEFYLRKFCDAFHRPIVGISNDAMLALREYHWPGNVRELINVIERAVITCQEGMITTRHLPFNTDDYEAMSNLNLKDVEKFYVGLALRRAHHNKSKAAELLGISRKTLIEKVKNYGLEEAAGR